MQFLAVGKAAFNRFFAAGIDGLATLRQAVGADAFPSIFPYVTRYDTSACLAGRASLKKLTCFTNLRIRGVFALAGPVGGPVPQKAVCGADVAIHRVVVEKVLASEASRIFSEKVVADHPKNSSVFKTLKRQAYGYQDQEFFKLRIRGIHEAKYALTG